MTTVTTVVLVVIVSPIHTRDCIVSLWPVENRSRVRPVLVSLPEKRAPLVAAQSRRHTRLHASRARESLKKKRKRRRNAHDNTIRVVRMAANPAERDGLSRLSDFLGGERSKAAKFAECYLIKG